jgi:hypothetical protein
MKLEIVSSIINSVYLKLNKIKHLPSWDKSFPLQVAPAELEAILLTHPSIEDAAVVP